MTAQRTSIVSSTAFLLLVSVIDCGLSAELLRSNPKVEVIGRNRRVIYRSPQKPGFTCWTGIWSMPDQSLMVAFVQATGPLKGRPKAPPEIRKRLSWPPAGREYYDMTGLDLSNVYLRSSDQGKTWKKVSQDHFRSCMNGAAVHRAQMSLDDGTVLRSVWGRYLPYEKPPVLQTGLFQRSSDGTKTWSPYKPVLDPKKYTMFISRMQRLRDGRCIAYGGVANLPSNNKLTRHQFGRRLYPGLLVSDKHARNWKGPIPVVPKDLRKNWGGEEFDLAELPNGDLFVVYRRVDPKSVKRNREVRWQGLLKKKGKTWIPQHAKPAPFPHSGHPNLLATREGIVMHIATSGIHWTSDAGQSWHRVPGRGTNYYPESVQTKDGQILITSHIGGDNAYGSVDQSILLESFRLKVTR